MPCGLLWLPVCHVFCILYTFLCYNKKTRQTLAYDVAVHRPFRACVFTTITGTRRQFRHASSIGFWRHALSYRVDKCEPKVIYTPEFAAQKLEYIHNNPVDTDIVKAEEYIYSSAGIIIMASNAGF